MRSEFLIVNQTEKLRSLNFVKCTEGPVQLGTRRPLKCQIEGHRKNETPLNYAWVENFWINKFCVANIDYEKFQPTHQRPITGIHDKSPVTDITYRESLAYAEWLSQKHGILFCLPNELEWIRAAAPFNWEYPYQRKGKPNLNYAHTFNRDNPCTVPVDDKLYPVSHLGLYHIGGNVMEMTQGWYYAKGHFGYVTDGAYYIAKGGNYGHCPYSARVHTRAIIDVSDRSTRVGFRLICRENNNYEKQ